MTTAYPISSQAYHEWHAVALKYGELVEALGKCHHNQAEAEACLADLEEVGAAAYAAMDEVAPASELDPDGCWMPPA